MGHTIESIWIQRPRSEGYLASSTIADIALKSKQCVFAMAYAVVFLLPTFDVFPWSYGVWRRSPLSARDHSRTRRRSAWPGEDEGNTEPRSL